ncbi:hypothetical protein EST38_g1299 [Candolleomyces aberdarensis]|uniref:Uncharacterized protein n=1 Tax=Candolleomyces aberdarensis TaxID=2316362 RepID=A0A4Q2DYI5_9AGAR|nr:hypothetical protein EST38_g1299 [Candolleomyces aberdarensis]
MEAVKEEEGKPETPPKEKTPREDTDGESKVAAAVSAAKAALEAAAAAASEASPSKLSLAASNANPKPESVKLESSFEDIRVAEKQYFRTSKPRIIPTIFIPPASPASPQTAKPDGGAHTNDARLPVDDRDSLPPTPVAIEGPNSHAGPNRESATGPSAVICIPSPAISPDSHSQTPHWLGHHPNLSSSTLPLRIEKRSRKSATEGTADSRSPEAPAPAPPAKEFIVPKGSANPSRETLKPRTRAKLVKPKSTPNEEMQQFRAFIAGRDGAGRGLPTNGMHADPWRPRPLISHAKSASRSSGCSMDSATTYNPPSSIDHGDRPRISISSTIYPSSTENPSLPNTANEPNFPSHISSDGGSFIDVVTPYSPRFAVNESSEEDYDYEYEPYPRNDILHEIQSEQVIDSDNYQLMSILAGTNMIRTRSRSPKPPVPRTPKPIYTRKPMSTPSSPSTSPVATSLVFEGYRLSSDCEPPPTTNWLDKEERADLIRKSRKLARVFGRTPGADMMAYQQESRSAAIITAEKHQRTHLSLSSKDATSSRRRASAYPSPTESQFSQNSGGRRHSLPLSPDDISFLNVSSPLYDASLSQVASQFRCESSATGTVADFSSRQEDSSTDHQAVTNHESDNNATAHNSLSSPSRTSFLDWSEEEGDNHGRSINTQDPPRKAGTNRRPPSPSHSLFENMTPEEQAEEEKRRKRDKLAKLHRFLGSTVPVNLIVGSDTETMLQETRPPTAASTSSGGGKAGSSDLDEASRKAWLRRRRSSSAAAIPSDWSNSLDRMKEELDTKEKLINVRRAQKMEKVFGVAPPQSLYHTRGHTPSPSLPSLTPMAVKTLGNPSALIPTSEAAYFTRNSNRSSYEKSGSNSRKLRRRPDTSESNKQLIPKGRRSSSTASLSFGSIPAGYGLDDQVSQNRDIFQDSKAGTPPKHAKRESVGSAIYNHYQHSLRSLNDILDRDDCESLVELHHYLNNPDHATTHATTHDDVLSSTRPFERRPSDAASIRTERRHSLPVQSSAESIITLASEHTVAPGEAPATPKPELTDFQMRRRRAAKLTQFFGVQYRELINDVLDSLEHGLEHEQKRGTLQAGEIADLLERLRELKVRREGIQV